MRRIKITLAYDGGPFHGWQVQPGLPTIQGALEEVLAGHRGPARFRWPARDAPMPASMRSRRWPPSAIANPIPLPNLRRAVNRLLPPAIRVLTAEEAPAAFHPRFDCACQDVRIPDLPRAKSAALSNGPTCTTIPILWTRTA